MSRTIGGVLGATKAAPGLPHGRRNSEVGAGEVFEHVVRAYDDVEALLAEAYLDV